MGQACHVQLLMVYCRNLSASSKLPASFSAVIPEPEGRDCNIEVPVRYERLKVSYSLHIDQSTAERSFSGEG